MSRKSEFAGSYEKPAQMYLEWSSDEKCFKYWDNVEKENKLVQLPITFLVLKEFHAVKGWHDKSQSGIYSNEVKNISQEQIEVKSFKGGTLAKGIYKDIKEIIGNVGGRYVKSIYAMLKDGTIVNIQLKGAAVKEWGEAFNKGRSRLADEWVTISEANEMKKGKVNYSVPVFKFDHSLSDTEGKLADEVYERLDGLLSNKRSEALKVEDAGEFATLEDEDVDF